MGAVATHPGMVQSVTLEHLHPRRQRFTTRLLESPASHPTPTRLHLPWFEQTVPGISSILSKLGPAVDLGTIIAELIPMGRFELFTDVLGPAKNCLPSVMRGGARHEVARSHLDMLGNPRIDVVIPCQVWLPT